MVNIRQSDIAKELNISRVTVSKALRDHPDISPTVKKKIVETASKMGYVPNLLEYLDMGSMKLQTSSIPS